MANKRRFKYCTQLSENIDEQLSLGLFMAKKSALYTKSGQVVQADSAEIAAKSLNHPEFCHRTALIMPDDKVIEHPNVDGGECFAQPLGYCLV